MRIHVLALNGVFDTSLSASASMPSGIANFLAERTGISPLRFRVKVVGLRKTITTARGLSVPVTAAARAQTPDVVVMPAISQLMPEPLLQALATSEVRDAGTVLRKWSERGVSSRDRRLCRHLHAGRNRRCSLGGEEATCWWPCAAVPAALSTRSELDESRIVVQSTRWCCRRRSAAWTWRYQA